GSYRWIHQDYASAAPLLDGGHVRMQNIGDGSTLQHVFHTFDRQRLISAFCEIGTEVELVGRFKCPGSSIGRDTTVAVEITSTEAVKHLGQEIQQRIGSSNKQSAATGGDEYSGALLQRTESSDSVVVAGDMNAQDRVFSGGDDDNDPPGCNHISTRRIIRRQVKLSVRADREAWWTRKAEDMEDAKNAGNRSAVTPFRFWHLAVHLSIYDYDIFEYQDFMLHCSSSGAVNLFTLLAVSNKADTPSFIGVQVPMKFGFTEVPLSDSGHIRRTVYLDNDWYWTTCVVLIPWSALVEHSPILQRRFEVRAVELTQVDPNAVFVNNEVKLSNLQIFGFDFDHTLATYTKALDEFIFNEARDWMVKQLKSCHLIVVLELHCYNAHAGCTHWDVVLQMSRKIKRMNRSKSENGSVHHHQLKVLGYRIQTNEDKPESKSFSLPESAYVPPEGRPESGKDGPLDLPRVLAVRNPEFVVAEQLLLLFYNLLDDVTEGCQITRRFVKYTDACRQTATVQSSNVSGIWLISNWNMRRPGAAHSVAWKHHKRDSAGFQYPDDLMNFTYSPDFAIRGLHYDVKKGYLMKVDAYHHIQLDTVYRGFTPVSYEETLEVYNGSHLPSDILKQNTLTSSALAMRSSSKLMDFFTIPEFYLLSSIIELFERQKIKYQPINVYQDVSSSVSRVHKSGLLGLNIMANPERHIYRDPHLPAFLNKLVTDGRKLFLISNSSAAFIDRGMRFLIGEDWRELFDVIISRANKPLFFQQSANQFRHMDDRGHFKDWEGVRSLSRGHIYDGGCLEQLISLTHWNAQHILYFGDHVYSDLADVSNLQGWTTAAVIPELEHEIMVNNTLEFRRCSTKLRHLEELINSYQVIRIVLVLIVHFHPSHLQFWLQHVMAAISRIRTKWPIRSSFELGSFFARDCPDFSAPPELRKLVVAVCDCTTGMPLGCPVVLVTRNRRKWDSESCVPSGSLSARRSSGSHTAIHSGVTIPLLDSNFLCAPSTLLVTSAQKVERNELRISSKISFNKYFGSIFRSFHNPSYFSRRLAQYAVLYTSKVSNIYRYPLDHIFYPKRPNFRVSFMMVTDFSIFVVRAYELRLLVFEETHRLPRSPSDSFALLSCVPDKRTFRTHIALSRYSLLD
ncbi:5'-nucleotidase domain-containing protein 3, partial [Clonorchis sinensis]